MSERSDTKWVSAATDFLKKKKSADAAEVKLKEARAKIIKLAGDQSARGAGVACDKLRRAGSVDYTSIPVLADVNLNLYRKPDTYYFTVQAG